MEKVTWQRWNVPRGLRVVVDQPPRDVADDYRAGGREQPGDLVISWRWFDAKTTLPGLAFCLFWDAFFVAWYANAFRAYLEGRTPLGLAILFAAFPIAHVWIGLRTTLGTFAELANTTRIGAVGGAVWVRHGPLPGREDVELAARSIEALSAREVATTTRRKRNGRRYAVDARVAGGVTVTLVDELMALEQARFVVEALSERLDLATQP